MAPFGGYASCPGLAAVGQDDLGVIPEKVGDSGLIVSQIPSEERTVSVLRPLRELSSPSLQETSSQAHETGSQLIFGHLARLHPQVGH